MSAEWGKGSSQMLPNSSQSAFLQCPNLEIMRHFIGKMSLRFTLTALCDDEKEGENGFDLEENT